MIAPVAAIIGQRHDSIGKLLIMRSHSTRIPKSPNIFRRIETESGSIAKTAGGIPAIKGLDKPTSLLSLAHYLL